MKRKGLMLLAFGLLVSGVTACDSQTPLPDEPNNPTDDDNPFDDGMDFDQNEDIEKVDYHCTIVGAKWGGPNGWDPAASGEDENLLLKKVDDFTYTITFDVAAGDEFKFILNGSWTTQYGMEDIDWDLSTDLLHGEKSDYNQGTGNRSDIKLDEDATIKVDYHPYYFLEEGVTNFLVITEVAE